jgi:dTDP-4-amino-4,6-dideoxygalactose transaminase
VTTNDAKVAENIRAFRNCGQRQKNVHELVPFNHRLDNLQAAILRVKLPHLNQWCEARHNLGSLYTRLLAGSGLLLPVEPPGYRHVYHLYVIRTQKRDELMAQLKERGIGTAIHYPKPVHMQPFYMKNGHPQGSFPVAEQICDEILSLPMFPELTEEQVNTVVSEIAAVSVPS